jgi:putative DNA methylase
MTAYPKRLIEVDLPIKRISEHSRREKSIRQGHISTMHIWWARRPLAACRAVICAALWPDPQDPLCPQIFRDEASRLINEFARKAATDKELAANCSNENWGKWQTLTNSGGLDSTKEAHWNVLRFALLDFIADFANWDNSTVREYLETSRALTLAAHVALGGSPGTRPLVADPFAGGGSIPLEALRVGADAFASDLNPIPVLLNRVALEYIPRHGQQISQRLPILVDSVLKKALVRLRDAYPPEKDGSTPLAYIWARTILSEAPGQGDIPIEVPLISSMWLSKKPRRGRALRWKLTTERRVQTEVVEVKYANGELRRVKRPCLEVFEPDFVAEVPPGTTARGSVTCPITNFTTPVQAVRRQLNARRGGTSDARPIAVVTVRSEEKGRFYRVANDHDEAAARMSSVYLGRLAEKLSRGGLSPIPTARVPDRDSHRSVASLDVYGFQTFGDLFLERQKLVILTLADSIHDAVAELQIPDQSEERALRTTCYLIIGKLLDYCSSLSSWSSPASQETVRGSFGRQTLGMVWDFAEANIFAPSSGGWKHMAGFFIKAVDYLASLGLREATVQRSDAVHHPLPNESVSAFITDPPYYDSIAYGELADYFYVWLRPMLIDSEEEIFALPTTPKKEQAIVWHPNRPEERVECEDKMRRAMAEGFRITATDGIAVVVFAHKSTSGWETQLQSMISGGWVVTASWPIDTERAGRTNSNNTASLASSIHLVCRKRETDETGDWRDILTELPKRIHDWMPRLAGEMVVGADAIFACLGPALEIFSRYSRVEKASGEQVTLKEYLEYVWAAVAKEALMMIFEGADATGFEEDARLTAMWLWTLSTGSNGSGAAIDVFEDDEQQDEEEDSGKKTKLTGFILEYDAARKIAQGLGAHLERLPSLVEIRGDKALLLPVSERARHLFGKDEGSAPTKRKGKPKQLSLLDVLGEADGEEAGWGEKNASRLGNTILDRIHQSMILFAASRSEALKRFLVNDGAGQDQRFWRLAQALSALYPKGTDERRWVEGVLARKKGLGF